MQDQNEDIPVIPTEELSHSTVASRKPLEIRRVITTCDSDNMEILSVKKGDLVVVEITANIAVKPYWVFVRQILSQRRGVIPISFLSTPLRGFKNEIEAALLNLMLLKGVEGMKGKFGQNFDVEKSDYFYDYVSDSESLDSDSTEPDKRALVYDNSTLFNSDDDFISLDSDFEFESEPEDQIKGPDDKVDKVLDPNCATDDVCLARVIFDFNFDECGESTKLRIRTNEFLSLLGTLEDPGEWVWVAKRSVPYSEGYVPKSYIEILLELNAQPWYVGRLAVDKDLSKLLLHDKTFLVKDANEKQDEYVVCARVGSKIKYKKLTPVEGEYFILANLKFRSVVELIEFHIHSVAEELQLGIPYNRFSNIERKTNEEKSGLDLEERVIKELKTGAFPEFRQVKYDMSKKRVKLTLEEMIQLQVHQLEVKAQINFSQSTHETHKLDSPKASLIQSSTHEATGALADDDKVCQLPNNNCHQSREEAENNPYYFQQKLSYFPQYYQNVIPFTPYHDPFLVGGGHHQLNSLPYNQMNLTYQLQSTDNSSHVNSRGSTDTISSQAKKAPLSNIHEQRRRINKILLLQKQQDLEKQMEAQPEIPSRNEKYQISDKKSAKKSEDPLTFAFTNSVLQSPYNYSQVKEGILLPPSASPTKSNVTKTHGNEMANQKSLPAAATTDYLVTLPDELSDRQDDSNSLKDKKSANFSSTTLSNDSKSNTEVKEQKSKNFVAKGKHFFKKLHTEAMKVNSSMASAKNQDYHTLTSDTEAVNPTRDKDKLLMPEVQSSHLDEIGPEAVKWVEAIGSGHYGEVWKVESSKYKKKFVAKTFDASLVQMEDFKMEVQRMFNLQHEHLIKIKKFCARNGRLFVIEKYYKHGSLLAFIVANYKEGKEIGEKFLVRMSHQVCAGMTYLEERGFVHGNLSARNVQLSDKMQAKISDFGFYRFLKEEEYDESSFRRHWKWKAPEVLGNPARWSSFSDVWSFGVFLWEIFSPGQQPYPYLSSRKRLLEVQRNEIFLYQPQDCPNWVYDRIMKQCWQFIPGERLSFKDIEPIFHNRAMESSSKSVRCIQEEMRMTHIKPISLIDFLVLNYAPIVSSDVKKVFSESI